jgi:predicted DNA-binding protein (MmcQ/YjbR family)
MTTAEFCDFCRTMPHANEDVKWGNDLVFTVGGKMFAVAELTDSGVGRISFKCTPGQFEAMEGRPGVTPSPYLARAHWISVIEPGALAADEVRECVETSYRLVWDKLTRRAKTELEGA